MFPTIHDINDVLPVIKDKKEFIHVDKGDYQVVNYVINGNDTFPDPNEPGITEKERNDRMILRECRGLLFAKDGTLLSRPFNKFFNAGEREETKLENLDFTERHWCLTKLDGSFIRPIMLPVNGQPEFRLGTKMGITEVSIQAENFVNQSDIRDKYNEFFRYCYDQNLTPVFEFLSSDPAYQIVVRHEKTDLVLIGLRENTYGDYMPYPDMVCLAEVYGIPVVQAIELTNLVPNEIVQVVKQFDTEEGIVLTFINGTRVKIKADAYLRKHRAKDALSREKDVLDLIVRNELDDFIPLLNEYDRDIVQRFETDVLFGMSESAREVQEFITEINQYLGTFDFESIADDPGKARRKEFAASVQRIPKHLQSIAFRVFDGQNAFETIRDTIQKNTGSNAGVQKIRELIGNVTLNSLIKID